VVRETAVDLVYGKVPPPTEAERRRALELAIQDAASHGITSLQDFSTWDDFLVLEKMEQEGRLPVRISEWLTFIDPVDTLIAQRAHHPQDDPMLHTGMLKGFMDGSLGSRTAALNAPYSDDPGNSGIPQFDQLTLNKMTVERAKAGFQIGFHAIGDRGAKMALDAFVAAEAAVPASAGYRFRIEHDQVIDPTDFARYKWLGVIASMQPNHLLTDMYWAEDRIGPQRAKSSYAWRTFVDQGTVLAFGTDYPVEPVTPFRGLYAAVTRKSEDGTRIYHPEQALTINQALYAYTQASAYAENMETRKGKLVPGQFADFVVLDRDLLNSPPTEILNTQVLRTVVGGKTVFLKK
jgi:predicted amidohydrolase YtcJ